LRIGKTFDQKFDEAKVEAQKAFGDDHLMLREIS
jgi:acetyl/propionyl-CoA carboxylase alpha subunit